MSKRIRNLLVVVLFICVSAPIASACCAGDIQNSIRKLQELDPNTTIARVRIDSAWQTRQQQLMSRATVVEHFYGHQLPDTFLLSTGLTNSSIIGTYTKKGQEYLVYTRFRFKDQVIFGAMGGCDMHSLGPLDHTACDEDYDGNLTDRYQVVTSYLDAVRTKYSGELEYLSCSGKPFAKGRLERGIPVGTWRYSDRFSEVSNEENIFNSEGKLVEYRKYSLSEKGRKHLFDHRYFVDNTTIYVQRDRDTGTLKDSTCVFTLDSESERVEKTVKYNAKGDALYKYSSIRFKSSKHNRHNILHGSYLRKDTEGGILMQGAYFYGARVGTWVEQPLHKMKTCGQKPNAKSAITIYYPFPDTVGFDRRWGFHENGQPAGKTYFLDSADCYVMVRNHEEGGAWIKTKVCGNIHVVESFDKKGRISRREVLDSMSRKQGLVEHFEYTSEGEQYYTMRGTYRDNRKIGEHKMWSKPGELFQIVSYDRLSRRHGKSTYYQNGVLFAEAQYAHGKPIGEHVVYHNSGKFKQRILFSQGGTVADVYDYDEEGLAYVHQRKSRPTYTFNDDPFELSPRNYSLGIPGYVDWGD